MELADYCEGLAREIDHSHFTHDLVGAAAELRRLAAVEAELERIRALPPVAWGWMKDGVVYDCISPKEHAKNPGAYTTPLFNLTKDPT